MYKFGPKSLERLKTCDTRIQTVMHKLIEEMDVTILEGVRTDERQNKLFAEGKSKLKAGQSKHNMEPSMAVDVAPWDSRSGIMWEDKERFCYMAGISKGIAKELGITLRWGGDWNMNGVLSDNRFNDLPHLELRTE